MRRRFAVIAAGATATVGMLLTQSPAPAAEPTGLTRPVQATKGDQDPGRLYSAPSLAVDPGNPMRMIAGFADLRTRRCGLLRSVDGGKTWTRPDASPNTPAYPFCSQSQGGVIQAPVAFGGGGMIYMGLGGWGEEEASRTGGAVMLARSSNLGDSWETTVVRTARGKTGDAAENLRPVQSIAVERNNGRDDVIYLTFAVTRPNADSPNDIPAAALVGVSRDGGRTFEEPVNLSDKVFEDKALRDRALAAVTTTIPAGTGSTTSTTVPPEGSKAATPNQAANFGAAGSRNGMVARVDGKGTAYVTWPTGAVNVNPSPPPGMALSKSTDGGKTWTSAVFLPPAYDNPRGGPANAYPQFVVSPEGSLHIVYNVNPTPGVEGASEAYHRASYDGGQTWTPPTALSDDRPEQLAGQFFPNISVAPNGRLDVVWFDTRDDPGIRSNDVYYTYSEDDGRTWSRNRRISDQTIDRRLGVYGLNYDITSPPGVASANEFAVIGWDDTRNSDPAAKANPELGGGAQDIYTAAVQFAAVGGGTSNAVKFVLAGVAGLVAVGLVLLLVALSQRRRTGGSQAKPGERKRATADVG